MSHGPSVAIRCESRAGSGFGHLTRMIALAEALRRNHGARIRFLCDANPMVERFLRSTEIPHAVGAGGETGEKVFLRRETASADLLIVDAKRDFTENFVHELRGRRRIVFIDRCCAGNFAADLTIIPCAALSDGIIGDPRWKGAAGALLHGAPFVLLNRRVLELCQCRGASARGGPVVLTTGGCDPAGVMLTVLPWLAELPPEREIAVLVGDAFLHRRELELLKVRLPGHVRFFPFSEDRLAGAAVAICTFGVTVYELMYLGIPVLVIGHSEENAETSGILAQRCGAAIDCGYIGNLNRENVIEPLLRLLGDSRRRAELSRAGMELIDGLGADRIAREVVALVS